MSRSLSQIMEAAKRSFLVAHGHEQDIVSLKNSWIASNGSLEEFSDFVPIRLVTIIESQVRAVVADAIGRGAPFEEKAIEIMDGWSAKQTFDALMAVRQKRIKIGEVAAHSLNVGDYKSIIKILNKILGTDVEESLKSVRTCWIEERDDDIPSIISDYSKMCTILKRLFYVRHVLVHEMPQEKPYTSDDLLNFCNHAYDFVASLGWLLPFTSQTFLPRSQTQMNISAWDEAQELENELAAMRGVTKEQAITQKSLQQQIEFHWDKFSELSANFAAEEFAGGSMAPMIRAATYADLLRWRLEKIATSPH